MGGRGNHDLAASRGLSPADAAAVRVDRLDALPGALVQLARLVAQSGYLRPDTVGRIAAEHARTVLILSDVLARRHMVAGTTAPALLGVPSELRSHASTLATLRAAVRGLRSAGDDDPLRRGSCARSVAGCAARTAGWQAGSPTTTCTPS